MYTLTSIAHWFSPHDLTDVYKPEKTLGSHLVSYLEAPKTEACFSKEIKTGIRWL